MSRAHILASPHGVISSTSLRYLRYDEEMVTIDSSSVVTGSHLACVYNVHHYVRTS